MNKILILILIIYSYCRTPEYYTKCPDGAPAYDNNKHSVSDCNQYNKEGVHCCLLTFKIEETTIAEISLADLAKNRKNIRSLEELEYSCFGITNYGYEKISDVIKEVEKETGVNQLKIDCNSNNLNILMLLLFLLLLLLI